MAQLVTVTLLLDVENDAEAADAVNEILREQQRDWTPTSCLIDYCIGNPEDYRGTLSGYEEGEMMAYVSEDLAGFTRAEY